MSLDTLTDNLTDFFSNMLFAVDAIARMRQIHEIEAITGQQLPEAVVRTVAEKLASAQQRMGTDPSIPSDIVVKFRECNEQAAAMVARYN